MTDMRPTIAPKSDQLNSDDLIAGARTVRITGVKANPDSAEQPISVFFDGDDGKPYKPCKSMRRVMVAVWGPDGSQYPGRSMTLYRDPSVQFGGLQVGGIRISHMSNMEGPMTMALTATRAKRAPYTVKPLDVAKEPEDKAATGAHALADRFRAVTNAGQYYTILDEERTATQMQWLKKNRPELFDVVDRARAAAAETMADTPAGETETAKEDAA